MNEEILEQFREELKKNIVIYKETLIDYDTTVRKLVMKGYNFIQHNENCKYIPSIGEEVYCIYHGFCIIPNTIYALTAHSFIVAGFRWKEEDGWEYHLNDFGKTWFSDVEQAKKALWELYQNDHEKYEMIERHHNEFEVRRRYD